jgi:hypothetical protein
MVKISFIWILGLVTMVPCGIYYLLFHAQRNQYALLITLVLFWIFGFWGVVGPIVSAVKIHRVFKALEMIRSPDELRNLLQSEDSQDVAIDLIASENRIPRFLAKRIYNFLVKRFSEAQRSPDGNI